MSSKLDERGLELLCDHTLFGVSDEELRELESLAPDALSGNDAVAFEFTAAQLSMINTDNAELPQHLFDKIVANSKQHVGVETNVFTAPRRDVIAEKQNSGAIWGWLGWAVAGAASIALAVNIFSPQSGTEVANLPKDPPVVEQKLTPLQLRQRLIDTEQAALRADWSKGTFKESEGISGDVVWSDAKQTGYMRISGLPVNDKAKNQYQLWIFEDSKLEKFPKDGGVFDVDENGEVIIPIDAKIAVNNPKAFAITVEKPGGVVVSERGQIAGLAPVKPSQS